MHRNIQTRSLTCPYSYMLGRAWNVYRTRQHQIVFLALCFISLPHFQRSQIVLQSHIWIAVYKPSDDRYGSPYDNIYCTLFTCASGFRTLQLILQMIFIISFMIGYGSQFSALLIFTGLATVMNYVFKIISRTEGTTQVLFRSPTHLAC